MGIDVPTEPDPNAGITLTYEEFLNGVAPMKEVDFPIARDPPEPGRQLVGWRLLYERAAYAVAFAGARSAKWSGPRCARWSTSNRSGRRSDGPRNQPNGRGRRPLPGASGSRPATGNAEDGHRVKRWRRVRGRTGAKY